MVVPTAQAPLKLMGAPGSPYTRKMVALLRYRRIPYTLYWGGHNADLPALEGFPKPKVRLLPTVYFKGDDGAVEAAVDSTPIIRRLEDMVQERSTLPDDPALGFLNYLIEDYADEWLTKAMFHYRWAYRADIDNAGPLLIYWHDPTIDRNTAQAMAQQFADRQIGRLYVVGSNATTAETIEASYKRLIAILDALITDQGYVLGARPASADFALYGQLTQLGIVDPTPARALALLSPRIRAWLDRVEDLSGLDPAPGDWVALAEAEETLKPLLSEIGRVYVPFLLANARTILAGEKTVVTDIDGRSWTQPAFPYQAKCLQWIREASAALPDHKRPFLRELFKGTGCEPLLED